VPQGSHLGPLFLIDDMDSVFRIFKHISALGYADDLKLFKRTVGVDDCLCFQSDLDRLHDWCQNNKFDLSVGKCRSISFSRCKVVATNLNVSIKLKTLGSSWIER
jgi:Reverse transcriptase (RNA-dependent DNA polymerase)